MYSKALIYRKQYKKHQEIKFLLQSIKKLFMFVKAKRLQAIKALEKITKLRK